MAELDNILEKYQNSEFYIKYKGTYFSDVILRDVFKCDVKLNRLYGLNKKTYEEIHQLNVELMRDFLNLFSNSVQVKDLEILWKMIYAFYLDPDSNGIKELKNVKCTADGLLSIKRIYRKYGMSEKTVSEYDRYRKKPIFFFPQEKNGINMARASVFGDRIDHTLFDLKRYFEKIKNGNMNECRLLSAYSLPKTKEWLYEMRSFDKLIDWYGVKGIFVSEKYEVYNIEKGDGSLITSYREEYNWLWSDIYYNNLKVLIDKCTG